VCALLAGLCLGGSIRVAAQTGGGAGSPHTASASEARKLRDRAAAQSAAALQALNQARRSGDPALRCLDDKLAQLNSTRRDIDERSVALERARSAGKQTEAEHQSLVLRYLERRLDRLDAEGRCQAPVASGQTRVEMSLRGPIPEDEPVEI
jgi:hypothetical protein